MLNFKHYDNYDRIVCKEAIKAFDIPPNKLQWSHMHKVLRTFTRVVWYKYNALKINKILIVHPGFHGIRIWFDQYFKR